MLLPTIIWNDNFRETTQTTRTTFQQQPVSSLMLCPCMCNCVIASMEWCTRHFCGEYIINPVRKQRIPNEQNIPTHEINLFRPRKVLKSHFRDQIHHTVDGIDILVSILSIMERTLIRWSFEHHPHSNPRQTEHFVMLWN